MNPLNRATLETSQRLAEKGIVLETEAYWCKTNRGWILLYKKEACKWAEIIPAAQFAEVWRELPAFIQHDDRQ